MNSTSVDAFRQHVVGYWTAIEQGDGDAATARTEAADTLVEGWRVEGTDDASLWPLLTETDPRVRYAAAAYLGVGDPEARVTLRKLAADSTGLVAPAARLLLMACDGERNSE